jgi:hypothetical protein
MRVYAAWSESQPAARQHARERGVALEQMMVERRAGMRDNQQCEHPEHDFVRFLGQFVQVMTLVDDMRKIDQVEPLQRKACGRIQYPPADRDREQQCVDRPVRERSNAFLPARRSRYRIWRSCIHAPQ